MWILIAGIIYLINIFSIITIIFIKRREPSVTFAWVMVFVFLPIVGFVLYFFFGSTRKLELLSRKINMKNIESEYQAIHDDFLRDMMSADSADLPPDLEQHRDMILMNSRNAGCLLTRDNSLDLLVDAEEKYEKLFRDIENAKTDINVLYFIIKPPDKSGRDFINLLAKKAAEGVKVRVIYDRFGWLFARYRDFKPIIDAGGQVVRFLPSLWRSIVTVNYRMHRKIVVIDGVIGYTGGINIGDDYLGLYPKITPWRDTSVRVTGSAVQELQLRFLEDWVFLELQSKRIPDTVFGMSSEELTRTFFPPPIECGNSAVQIISGGPDEQFSAHKDSYQKIISDAKQYLYIQTPYFVPNGTLIDTLRLAVRSGVDVRIMLPGIPDKWYVYHITMSYVGDLLDAGARIFIHSGFLHAKTIVSDDSISSVGSANFDIRSFNLDYELNALVYDRDFAIECRDTFERDMSDCHELSLEEYKSRGFLRHVKESFFRFVAPLT